MFSENWKEKALANLFRKFRFPDKNKRVMIIEEKELSVLKQETNKKETFISLTLRPKNSPRVTFLGKVEKM